MAIAEPAERLNGDQPAAASPQGLADRNELALIALERTRMPMVVTDPRQDDNPIVLANQAFMDLTGYGAIEILGRNCRFLQGPTTDRAEIAKVREAISQETELTAEFLNYRKDGSSFWNQLFLSPVHDDEGRLLYFFGSCMDVSKRRAAQELEAAEHRLLLEVDHRAKNALALVQGIVRLSHGEDVEAFSRVVQGRVDALARAHGLLAEDGWKDVPLRRLLEGEIAPFGRRHFSLDGPPIEINAKQVQPLSLLFHEMLSNAARHGSLLASGGSVSISWTEQSGRDQLVIRWKEAGGPPPLNRKPGFGTTMINATASRQLNGAVVFEWNVSGLECILSIGRGDG